MVQLVHCLNYQGLTRKQLNFDLLFVSTIENNNYLCASKTESGIMKYKAIKVKTRDTFGSSEAGKLRRQGLIPCVLYGGDGDNIHFYGFVNDFRDVIYTAEVYKVGLHFDDRVIEAIVRDVQFHPLSDEIIHVDFYEVTDDKIVSTVIPIAFLGTPEGIKDGGRFYRKTRKLNIKGRVKNIPNQLEINVAPLKINENLKIRDLSFEGIELLNNPAVTVASVLPPKGMKVEEMLGEEAEEAEEGAETEGTEGEEATEKTEE